MRFKLIFVPVGILMAMLLFHGPVDAEDTKDDPIRLKFGFALSYGNSFHPNNDIGFLQGNYLAMFDVEKIGSQPMPEDLRFKVEVNFGSTTTPEQWVMASGAGLVLYYLDFLNSPSVRPYLEGGLGIIYTGFRVKGQGSHLNFNPKAGIGLEFPIGCQSLFTTLRWDHLSNAGLSQDNTSVDSVIFMFGAYF